MAWVTTDDVKKVSGKTYWRDYTKKEDATDRTK